MNKTIAALVLAGFATAASAADQIRIGFMSTLSGPSAALGIDIRDAFALALKANGGRLGGVPAEMIVVDDQMNPDTGKQLAARLLKKDRVDVVTGIVFSNVMLAVAPAILDNQTFLVSANAGPGAFSGEGCNPYFYAVSWQNDGYHEAAGHYATTKGLKSVVLLAPNYPAGKDALTGFKRLYKGQVVDEIYTKLGQLDFAAELAQVRAAKPEAVYIFQPGGMGINFIKQWTAAGLNRQMTLITPGFSADEDVIKAVGDPMLGMFNTSHWAHDLGNAENRRFVTDFQKEYGRLPTVYAAQGYDTARLIAAAVRETKGKIEDKAAFGKALAAAPFKSVRGEFRFNVNHFPVQSYYLRQIWRDPGGRITNKLVSTVLTNHADFYAPACRMKPW